MYRSLFKSIFDKIIGSTLLLLVSPIIAIVSIVLTITNRGIPFFIQERPGKEGKIFKIMKFKTMNDRRDDTGKLLPDRDRLTNIGRFIRSLSLDELPQLINIIIGDMSLVGPRPLLVNYLSLYNSFQNRRHEVKPGITGWAQVNGRNAITWEEKFQMDIWYVDHLSLSLDIKILWLTLVKVLRKEGINSSDAATMKPFTGN
jgi:undecaprenyl phosphate N,N'-diacetylbacillosamine 1-phosphate transferase